MRATPEYVTVPCFATPRESILHQASPGQHGEQPEDTPNVQTITVIAGVEVDTFFGCWLDINQPQQTFLPADAARRESSMDRGPG